MARKEEQAAAHRGERVRELARAVLDQLPRGPVSLITTTAEGAAVAGAVAVLREDPTEWRVVHLGRRLQIDGQVFVVEAVRLGDGVREALLGAFPDAIILDGRAMPRFARAA
jgi:hypothetical protein